MWEWLEPRVLIGPCMIVIGAFMLTVAYRLWAVHPINRVFRLGPLVTEEGLAAVIRLRMLFLSLGLFLTTWGLANAIWWAMADGNVNYPPVRFLGAFGSVFGIWSSILVCIAAVRLWVAK